MLQLRSVARSLRSLPRCHSSGSIRRFASPSAKTPSDPGYWDDEDEGAARPIPGKQGEGYHAFGELAKEMEIISRPGHVFGKSGPGRIREAEKLQEFWAKRVTPKTENKDVRAATYRLEKVYRMQKYTDIFRDATFVLAFQHSMSPEEIREFKTTVEQKSKNRLTVKPIIKVSLCRVALQKGFEGKYKGLAPLFNGPTSIVYGNCPDNFLTDISMLLKKENEKLFFLGGVIEGSIADHVTVGLLKNFTDKVQIRSQLIQALQQPQHNLVRVLKFPQDGLVKVLDFKAKPAEEATE